VLERALSDAAAHAEVDSGRLAEPFWYVDSPLTTPHPTRVFTGRPARGEIPPVVPGVLVPDVPINVPDEPRITRLREAVRDGILVLTAGDSTLVAAGAVTPAPLRTLAIPDIDPSGLLAESLDAQPGEAFVLRPDGHLAAVVAQENASALSAAVRRALGSSARGTSEGRALPRQRDDRTPAGEAPQTG
jgi:3-(3-hydroxy-phenyl)propionate hydroxylase